MIFWVFLYGRKHCRKRRKCWLPAFSPIRTIFSKALSVKVLKSGDCMVKGKPFPKQALVFTCLQKKSVENTVRKEEIARNEQFLLFPQCFLPI